MGLTTEEAANALRFSAGWLTPDTAWEELRATLVRIHAEAARDTDA
jgi:hypothetical protein